MEITGVRTHITIGSIDVVRSPRVRIEYTDRPLSRARVLLADADGEIYRSVAAGDAVRVRYGYLDKTPEEWSGTVSWRRTGQTPDQVEIGAVGIEAPISTRNITQAWVNETPDAIVRWAIGKTGLPIGKINSPGVTFPRFIAATEPVWQVVRRCEYTCSQAFGLDMSGWRLWVDAEGLVNWGDFDEDADVPVIETASGLITHSPTDSEMGFGVVETYLLPWLRNRQLFKLRDRRRGISGSFRAGPVLHEMTGAQARTYIRYREAA